MKALIVGPEGSPYAHGLFMYETTFTEYQFCANSSCRFDLFLDANYPISPPKMAFVLDGNDNENYSFNPNLHRGGGGTYRLMIILPGQTCTLVLLSDNQRIKPNAVFSSLPVPSQHVGG
jgi:hypothetical protein